MKKTILTLLAGIVIGALLATWLFSLNEYGYFDKPYKISGAAFKERLEKSAFDSHGEWDIEPYSDEQYLVTYLLPFKRQRFFVDKSLVSALGPITKKERFYFVDGRISMDAAHPGVQGAR